MLALKVRSRKSSGGIIGDSSLRSRATKATAAMMPAAAAQGAPRPPHSISAYVVPASASEASTAPV